MGGNRAASVAELAHVHSAAVPKELPAHAAEQFQNLVPQHLHFRVLGFPSAVDLIHEQARITEHMQHSDERELVLQIAQSQPEREILSFIAGEWIAGMPFMAVAGIKSLLHGLDLEASVTGSRVAFGTTIKEDRGCIPDQNAL